jgi:hypothetical protein
MASREMICLEQHESRLACSLQATLLACFAMHHYTAIRPVEEIKPRGATPPPVLVERSAGAALERRRQNSTREKASDILHVENATLAAARLLLLGFRPPSPSSS